MAVEYVQGSMKEKVILFFFCIVLLSLSIFDENIASLFYDRQKMIAQELVQSYLYQALFELVFFILIALLSYKPCKLFNQQKRWPPIGYNVPFRTKVVHHNKLTVRILLVIYFISLAVMAVLPFIQWHVIQSLLLPPT